MWSISPRLLLIRDVKNSLMTFCCWRGSIRWFFQTSTEHRRCGVSYFIKLRVSSTCSLRTFFANTTVHLAGSRQWLMFASNGDCIMPGEILKYPAKYDHVFVSFHVRFTASHLRRIVTSTTVCMSFDALMVCRLVTFTDWNRRVCREDSLWLLSSGLLFLGLTSLLRLFVPENKKIRNCVLAPLFWSQQPTKVVTLLTAEHCSELCVVLWHWWWW